MMASGPWLLGTRFNYATGVAIASVCAGGVPGTRQRVREDTFTRVDTPPGKGS